MPLKNRLVLVVRVPLTDGEMLPVPLISTGGRSALTPASDDSRCVKLPVDVGIDLELRAGQAPRGRRCRRREERGVRRHLTVSETARPRASPARNV